MITPGPQRQSALFQKLTVYAERILYVPKITTKLKCAEFAHLIFFFVTFFGYFPKPPQWVNPTTYLVSTDIGVKQWVLAQAACYSHLGSFLKTLMLGPCLPLSFAGLG